MNFGSKNKEINDCELMTLTLVTMSKDSIQKKTKERGTLALKITYKKINEPRTVSEREENSQINKATPNTKNIVIEENSEKRRRKKTSQSI